MLTKVTWPGILRKTQTRKFVKSKKWTTEQVNGACSKLTITVLSKDGVLLLLLLSLSKYLPTENE